jgi:hypothetical protein
MADIFRHLRDGDLHLFISNGTPAMDILVRANNQTLVDMALQKSASHDLIVNGTFNEYSNWDLFGSSKPLPVKSVKPTGPVVQDGKVISKAAGDGKYYLAYSESKKERVYFVGTGSLPANCTSGLGGLGGLVFLNRRHDAKNEYDKTVPPGAPERGEPPPRYASHLTRRGNAMYANIEDRGWSVGKVAIGMTASAGIIVAVQADGTKGISLDSFRDKVIAKGARSGVLLDCSDSACLVYKGKVLVMPASHKNRSSAIAIGFRA